MQTTLELDFCLFPSLGLSGLLSVTDDDNEEEDDDMTELPVGGGHLISASFVVIVAGCFSHHGRRVPDRPGCAGPSGDPHAGFAKEARDTTTGCSSPPASFITVVGFGPIMYTASLLPSVWNVVMPFWLGRAAVLASHIRKTRSWGPAPLRGKLPPVPAAFGLNGLAFMWVHAGPAGWAPSDEVTFVGTGPLLYAFCSMGLRLV